MAEELLMDAVGAALPLEFDDLRAEIIPLLEVAQMRRPSEKTRAVYKRAFARMLVRNMLPERIGARSRRSFQLYRASIVYTLLTRLETLCRRACACSERDKITKIRDEITWVLHILDRYYPGGNGSSIWKRSEAGVVHKGKRIGMSLIPRGGLARMVAAFADDPVYADPLRVLFLTGVRPSELVHGVAVLVTSKWQLRFTVRGAKVTDKTGQPVRVIEVAVDNDVAKALANNAAAGGLMVRVADARKFSDKIRGMSKRLFPAIGYVISPYTFRHALAAREKARGRAVSSLAQVLGHVSGRSQRGYGTPQQGKHLPGRICAANAERPVCNTDLPKWSELVAAANAEAISPTLQNSSGVDETAVTPM